MFGAHNSQIATLVGRQTRYSMLAKVASKDTQTVVDALIKNTRKLPQELYKSLTWDRGKETAGHKRFTLPPTSKSTSVIHAVLGNAAATRTRTVCSGSTCPEASTSRAIHKPTQRCSKTIERAAKEDTWLPDAG